MKEEGSSLRRKAGLSFLMINRDNWGN